MCHIFLLHICQKNRGHQGGLLATEGRGLTIKLSGRFPALTRVAGQRVQPPTGANAISGIQHSAFVPLPFRSQFIKSLSSILVAYSAWRKCNLEEVLVQCGQLEAPAICGILQHTGFNFQPPSLTSLPLSLHARYHLPVRTETGVPVTAHERQKQNFHTHHNSISSLNGGV